MQHFQQLRKVKQLRKSGQHWPTLAVSPGVKWDFKGGGGGGEEPQ